jgi:hypothetical protein
MRYVDHIRRTGGAGEEVHKFLDQYYQLYRDDHRVILHHKKVLPLIAKKFGPDAVVIAETHIRDDYEGKLPEFLDRQYFREAWAYDIDMYREAVKKAKEIFEKEGV